MAGRRLAADPALQTLTAARMPPAPTGAALLWRLVTFVAVTASLAGLLHRLAGHKAGQPGVERHAGLLRRQRGDVLQFRRQSQRQAVDVTLVEVELEVRAGHFLGRGTRDGEFQAVRLVNELREDGTGRRLVDLLHDLLQHVVDSTRQRVAPCREQALESGALL